MIMRPKKRKFDKSCYIPNSETASNSTRHSLIVSKAESEGISTNFKHRVRLMAKRK